VLPISLLRFFKRGVTGRRWVGLTSLLFSSHGIKHEKIKSRSDLTILKGIIMLHFK
jgi:hypothetical protein